MMQRLQPKPSPAPMDNKMLAWARLGTHACSSYADRSALQKYNQLCTDTAEYYWGGYTEQELDRKHV